jgi:hypothetical protein
MKLGVADAVPIVGFDNWRLLPARHGHRSLSADTNLSSNLVAKAGGGYFPAWSASGICFQTLDLIAGRNKKVWRDDLGENGASIRMRRGGRVA